MKLRTIGFLFLVVCTLFLPSASAEYSIEHATVYIDDDNVYMSATPHTIASSGWVYFNLTSKQYTGDIDVLWGFNTSVSRPTKAELYAPHWANTTTDHKRTFNNVSQFQVYNGDNLDYGNHYNNFQYEVTYEIPIWNEITMELEGYEQKISNVSFDSQVQDGNDHTAYWHTRHDQWILWKDKTSTFNSITHDYQGYNKWYYVKDVNVNAGQEYLLRAWVEVPISLTPQNGKYYFAVKPSGQTIPQAIATGHFYALDPWWNSSWSYYKSIIINQTMVNQSIGTGAFPMLVSITDSDLSVHAQADGDDIVFTDSAKTTQLSHEIEYWNKTTGVLVSWIKISDIKNVSSINMYYNNSGAVNTQNADDVWDSNYKGVWHLNEDGGTAYDSTNNNEDLTETSGTIPAVPGIIGSGRDFEFDHTEYLVHADGGSTDISGADQQLTLSAWVNSESFPVSWAYIISKYDTTLNERQYGLYTYEFGIDEDTSSFIISSDGSLTKSVASDTKLNIDTWYYCVAVYDDNELIMYLNGTRESSVANTTGIYDGSADFLIGARLGNGVPARYLDGIADESRVSDIARSGAYIQTNYNNSAYPKLFISLGAEQYKVPIITLESFYPSPLNTNYTGATTISYMVESYYPLNLSSLAFLYGLNYTITGDMHNYVASPPNSISFEGLYRAPNRNVTPYLSWEFNDTITEGNVWQWGGGDNNSWWISKNQINSTHTYINATGVTQHVLPSSFYLQKLAMYNAPKTGFEINRQQGLIFKFWNVEHLRNRNFNYFANLYFDTSWESTLPTHPIEIGFCNNSYNPAVDDIDTCQYCTKFGEWDGNRWVNHSWMPGANASYAYPFVVNGSQYTTPSPDEVNYIWQRSNTISSKSYVLNATNYDPGITNITFAETNTMWTYNELNGVTTPVAYTPSFFTTFVRDYEELLHHLYIADDTGAWGHSEIFNETIGLSSVPVSPISFEHFNVTCQGNYIEDTLMDATYDEGSILVNIHCPADPDGGTVSHNLTLHYTNNQTLVSVINDTFTTTGDEYVDINFTTTPYYSSSDFYTLRCVSTDDENDVATKWLISDFTLDADGNQGWVVDDALLFWGMDDIPTLYATIANNSLISYNAGSDIYTMHVPFFKSKSNDTFYFNETVHLWSLNNEDVAYFRHSGQTIFDYAVIQAWNTTTDTAAPTTDEYRSYIFSHFHVCGNITNSDFSYLGSDLYRQEGLNFIDNLHDYLIYNTTFSHNTEGPIMEYCSNMNISQCTITNNVNVGIGIYFTDDIVVSNNVLNSNGGRSITMYEANNNIISYNDITNSGIHGVHYWSNSINNTCTGNDISGSALYDYYLSSSSTGNFIINPASTTDRIRVTSTSSINIENTDNAVFSEDSLNISYAYLTNFSMYVSGASQTIDITQRDMTITPSNDYLSIQNFDWGNTIQFNAESSIGVNQTWFNITNTRWKTEQISIFIDGLPHNISHADDNGTLDYNYSVSIGDNFFEFILTIPPSPVPVSLFMFMGVLLFVFCGASFILTGIPSIFTSILSIMFSFIMSKIAVNGSLVQNIGGISSTGTVVQGVTRIEIPALSYILIFVGIFMTVILAVQVLREIKFRESQDVIELDL